MSGTETPQLSLETPQLTPQEFSRLFEEEEARVRGVEPPKVEPEPQEVVEEEPVVTEAATTEATTTTETEPGADTTASATDGGSTPNNEANDEWLAALDPNIKGQVEKILAEKKALEHKMKSDEGRVAAYQRHYDQQRREAEALRQQLGGKAPVTSKPPATTPAATPAVTSTQSNVPPEIQAIFDAGDETLARALLKNHQDAERTQAALQSKIEELERGVINPLQERYTRLHLERELDILETEMPGAKEVLAHDIWDDFKHYAPPYLRALAESADRDEVKTALQEYSLWIQRPEVQAFAAQKYGAPQQSTQATASHQPATQSQTARPADPQAVAKAQKVRAEAERKTAASPVASNAVGRPSTKKLSIEEILADPKLTAEHFNKTFEEELDKVYGRKPKK
jgi:hypothetical protein